MSSDTAARPGPFELPDLPYAENALAPVVSANTIVCHYHKHHQGYVDALNKLVEGTAYAGLPLERIISATADRSDRVAIFNNAAQCWNHAMYWRSLRPDGGGKPPASLKRLLEMSFDSVDACKKALAAAAVRHFGSGWIWLVLENDLLKVIETSNAGVPGNGQRALLAFDVWEHAYYLDYQNRRPEYIGATLDRLINWGFAADNLAAPARAPEESRAPVAIGAM